VIAAASIVFAVAARIASLPALVLQREWSGNRGNAPDEKT
jgi:hypothetical protein